MADTVTPEQPVETMGNVDQPKESESIDWTLPIIGITVLGVVILAIVIIVSVYKIRRLEFVRRFRARRYRDPYIRDLELQPQPPTTPGQRHMRDLEAARAANLSRAAPPCRPHPPVNPQTQRPSSRQRYNDRVFQQLANEPRPQRQPAWPRADRKQIRRVIPASRPSAASQARAPPAAAPRAPPAAVPRAPPTTPRPIEHHHQDVSFGSETTRVNSARALPSSDDPLPDPYQFEFSEHAQPGPVRPDSPPVESPPVNQFPYDSYQFEFSEHAQTRPHRAHPSSAAIERTVSPLDTSDITSSDARASIVSAMSEDEYHQGNMPAAPEPTVNPYGWSHTPRSVGPQPTARSAGPPRQALPRRAAVAPPRPPRSPEPEQPGVDLSNLYRPNN